jgi:predicted dehydrogenase
MMQDSSRPPLNVGLIGYGLAGASFHSPFIVTTPGMRLAAVVTASPQRQEQVRREHPNAEILSSVDELWAMAADLGLVVVASPNVSHVALATAAIRAGIPVLVDKPIAARSDQARALVREARDRGVLLTVYQNRRWDGDVQTLRQLLSSGELGEPLRFESRFERWRPEPKPGWRESGAAEDAGGLLVDLGSHLIDQALLLFGPVTHVYAELDRRRPGVEVDDDAFVALAHASGVRSHLWMSVMAADQAPRLRVRGTRAAYVKFGLDAQEDALRAGGRPNQPGWGQEPEERWGRIEGPTGARIVPTVPGSYQQFYRQLEAALRGTGPVPVDPQDSIRVLELIEAARTSAIERRVVTVTNHD